MVRRLSPISLLIALFASAPAALQAKTKHGPRIEHEAPPEQAILTALPIWVEVTGAVPQKVELKYKVLGVKKWRSLPMKTVNEGWGVEIPCKDVGTVTGTLRYYVVAYDADGQEIATAGTSKKPFKVRIRRTVKGEPLHLPGRPPPARCVDPADCPPNFPGCVAGPSADDACSSDDDCDEGLACVDQKCSERGSGMKDNLVTVAGQLDAVMWTDANHCASDRQQSGDYWCARDDGTAYWGNPEPYDQRTTARLAAVHAIIGFDRFVAQRFSLGLRAGVTAWGLSPPLEGRQRSLPVVGEVRMAYWFARPSPVMPYVFLGAGYAPRDAHFRTRLFEDTTLPPAQPDNPPDQLVTIYTTLGPYYVALGPGMVIPVSSTVGVMAEVEIARTLPRQGWAFSPALGLTFAF